MTQHESEQEGAVTTDMLKLSARLPARTALLLNRFRAKDDIRAYLEGFRVEPRYLLGNERAGNMENEYGAICLATDGRTMMVVLDPLAFSEDERFIPAPDAVAARILRDHGGKYRDQAYWNAWTDENGACRRVSITVSDKKGNSKTVHSRDVILHLERREFDWRSPIRRAGDESIPRGIRSPIQGGYLSRFFLSRAEWPGAATGGADCSPAVQFFQDNDADAPIFVRYPRAPELFGMLMGIREEDADPIPYWINHE